jgi:hypothetical protein
MSRTNPSAYNISSPQHLSTEALSSQACQVLRANISLDVGYPTLQTLSG